MSWRWVTEAVALAVHDRQLAEHGGADGIRDRGGFEVALARPQNQAVYGDPDAASLAAAYAFGIAKNHPFVDGNKRTAWVVARLFLAINDQRLTFEPIAAIRLVESLAAGEVSEADLATWFRERLAEETGPT